MDHADKDLQIKQQLVRSLSQKSPDKDDLLINLQNITICIIIMVLLPLIPLIPH